MHPRDMAPDEQVRHRQQADAQVTTFPYSKPAPSGRPKQITWFDSFCAEALDSERLETAQFVAVDSANQGQSERINMGAHREWMVEPHLKNY